MFLMGKEQALLFLAIAGPLFILAVALLSTAGTIGAILFAGLFVFLTLWSIARFFEILSMSDQDFHDKCPRCLIP